MQVMVMLQGMVYRTLVTNPEVTPKNPPKWLSDRPNAGYITAPPDMMREAIWTLFSRKIAGMGQYGAVIFNGLDLETDPKKREAARLRHGYHFTNPDTRLAIRDAYHRAGIPLGPLFRAVPERAPEVALYESAADDIVIGYGVGNRGWGSSYGDILAGANLPPYVLYDEEIERDGIPPSVKVILAPNCRAILDTTFRALKAFQKRGGIIVGDGYLVPGLMASLEFPGSQDLIGQFGRQKNSARDSQVMKRTIPQFKKLIAPRVKPYADSANSNLVVAARTYRSADYVFAINDNRTFGDYIGQWGIVEEKGLPNQGVVTVARADTQAVYDLVAHMAVPFRVKGGKTEIDVAYTTTDGRVFLVAPKKLGELTIRRLGQGLRAIVH